MGQLTYDQGALQLQCEDRTLTHLQIVIVNKLRRRESFAFSWVEPVSSGSGRGMIWLHPSANLVFRFDGNRPPAINAAWLKLLSTSADSTSGLRVLPEPDDNGSGPSRGVHIGSRTHATAITTAALTSRHPVG